MGSLLKCLPGSQLQRPALELLPASLRPQRQRVWLTEVTGARRTFTIDLRADATLADARAAAAAAVGGAAETISMYQVRLRVRGRGRVRARARVRVRVRVRVS